MRSRASGSALGVFAIVAATACWASAGVIAQQADLGGFDIAFWRMWMSALMFGAVAALAGRRFTLAWLRPTAWAGVTFGVTAALFFEALNHASVGIATVLAALTPVFAIPVAVRWLDERLTLLAVLAAGGAIGGVALFVAPGYRASGTRPLGVILALASTVLWVGYLFITKRARQQLGTFEFMTGMYITAGIALIPFVLVFGERGLRPPSHGWGWLILLAIVPGFLGHGLLTWAQVHVDMSVASVLLQGEPVGAALLGVIVLGETINAVQALGLVLAVVALAALARGSARAPTAAPIPPPIPVSE